MTSKRFTFVGINKNDVNESIINNDSYLEQLNSELQQYGELADIVFKEFERTNVINVWRI